ncbi:branched-chain amino acid ABC transporter permease [Geodermatophilus sabuli]|uniref:Amino acid/amide ABC transporter membrane protein 1, HAAT family n=1 Tax=Geodermatophilus sabuli TaxID=1564158 RepID=A0A285ELQ6_9ACTN|nr:branched-chain amino acid ABC transporter permease [Geodermatophilus sabuli]MBB3083684.1 branched-chain amino acid transport system permease protein [Geodermatophilus sabuli]SNX99114.1 amino acid/amide ABC transporter membrane protein 1, HAAT family [Geodermatophilus sabuli]
MLGWFDANLVSILNGFAIGALLFVLAVGLSIVFGMMDVLNLAHGAFFLVGSYLAVSFVAGDSWGGFLTALGVAAVVGLLAGAVLSGMTEPLARRPILDQALLTLGISLVVAEVLSIVYGNDVRSVSPPPGLDGSVDVAGSAYPTYRLMLIGVGLVLALVVWLVVERTSVGALVRASVADREMVSAMGIDNRKVKVAVLGIGSMLATVAGVLAAPVYGARPGLDETILLLALVVVVIGGLGSIRGALIGALVIGQVESLGRALLPDLASFILFGTLALVLIVRPRGLFAGKVAHS